MSIFDDIKESINNFFKETTTKYEKSNKWKEYKLGLTITHCLTCIERQNKIYDKDDIPIPCKTLKEVKDRILSIRKNLIQLSMLGAVPKDNIV